MIEKLFEYFIGSFFNAIVIYYIATKITERDFELCKFNIIKWIVLESIILIILYTFSFSNIFRISFNVFIIAFFYIIIFKDSIVKNIILSFATFSIISISECFLIVITKIDSFAIVNNRYDNFGMTNFSNILISLIMIFIINIKPLFKLYKKIFNDLIIKENINVIIIVLCFSICLSSLIYYMFFDIEIVNNFLITLFLIICYASFPIMIVKEKNTNYRLKIEYESVMKNIANYENSLIEQRMRNHENKNILATIKGMNKNKEIDEYIKQVLKDTCDDDKNILSKVKNIPIGGLQGLIYQKLLIMKSKKIEYFIYIERTINKTSLKKLSSKDIKDICTVIGILTDNAIQEVENKSKKYIGLYFYRENGNIIIKISNIYGGIINISLFDKKGFTTKSSGHGYGLSLVREIIENNELLENVKGIQGDVFFQKVVIKTSKKQFIN